MKTRFINRWAIFTFLFALVFVGCTDLLDQQPQGEWVEGDESGGGSFQSDIFTLYAQLRGFHIT